MTKPTRLHRQVAPDGEINLLDLLEVIADNLRLLILGPLATGILAFGYSFTITPTFTATTKFIPPKQQHSGTSAMLTNFGGAAGLAVGANNADRYVASLNSRTLQDALVDRFKLMELPGAKYREDARKAISDSVFIAADKDGIITIDAFDKDPVFAAQLAKAYVEELGNLMHHFTITEATQRRVSLESQLNNAKNNYRQAEEALKASGINSFVLKSSGAAVTEVAGLKGQITVQEIKLASMRSYITETAPDFKQAQTELAALRTQLNQIEKTSPVPSGAYFSNADYISRYRDFKYYETLLALFTTQYDMARIDESREAEPIQVLDTAQPPDLQNEPQRGKRVLFATLGSGIALLLFIFIRYAINVDLKKPEIDKKFRRLGKDLRIAIGRSPAIRE
jgi:tyrosine-protein kinase Etk/Wzc